MKIATTLEKTITITLTEKEAVALYLAVGFNNQFTLAKNIPWSNLHIYKHLASVNTKLVNNIDVERTLQLLHVNLGSSLK